MDKGQKGLRFWAVLAIILTLVISGVSFAISRYEVEKSKPDKEQTYALANKYYDAGDFVNAVGLYERYFTVFGVQDASVRIDYGYSLFKSGKQNEGFSMTKSVLSSDPENGAAQLNLAFMNFEAGKTQDALYWLKKCAVNSRDTAIATRERFALEELAKQK